MSFNGDPTIRGKGEAVRYTKYELEEYIKCSTDILYFAEKYFYILTLDEGKILIPLWDFQKQVLKAFVDPNSRNNKQNIIFMASRQISKSTLVTIFLLWKVMFFKEFRAAILCHKESLAVELLDRVQMAYSLLPKFLQVGCTEYNKKSIVFENLSYVKAFATSSAQIRGLSLNLCILDELAHVAPNIQQKLASAVLPSLSSGSKAMLIALSTPNGLEMFFNLFTDALRGENNYFPIKILWNQVPGRNLDWKETVIQSLPGKELQFAQEYDCKFFGAASTLVDSDCLEKITPIAPVELKWGGLLQIYEAPIKGKKYIIGIDVAGGTKKNYSVLQVIKVNKMKSIEQVAILRSNIISPYDLCKYIIDLSDFYNNCLVMIENNGDIGGIVCSTLFHQHEFERLIWIDGKVGVRSNKQSKAESCYLLKRYVEHGWIKINDRTTLYELSLFKEQAIGLFAADNNCNDDTVASLMWGIYAIHLPNISSDFFDENGEAIEDYSNGSGSDGMVALFD